MVKIYLITNSVNDKVYVGQTERTLARRFSNEKTAAQEGSMSILAQAMRDIGVDKFSIELIEEVPADQANEAENNWIKYYDSINSGYNAIYNGQSLADPFKAEMLELWEKGYSKLAIDREFGFREGTTKDRFRAWGIPPRKRLLVCRNPNGLLVGKYESISKAWLELFPEKSLATVKPYISRATKIGTPAYKYLWEWEDVTDEDR